jgi:hypothetical protein
MKFLASLALVAGLGMSSAAYAVPAAPLQNTPTQNASTSVTQVGWRCGPGWHINPWGRCVPNRRFYRGPRFYGGYGWGHRHWHHGWHHRHWHHR